MDRPLAAFDIETIPDTAVGRRVLAHSGSLVEVADAMLAERYEQTEGRTDFLKAPYHRVVTISIAWLDPRADEVRFKLDSLAMEDPTDEGALLDAFFHVLRRTPRLVSWNGNSFDLPVVRYRALLHGIDAAPYYDVGGYQHRYHDMHTDVMDVLAGYGASDRIGLDEMCRLLDLPGKTLTEGHRVYQHIARGEWDLVRTYCELDALGTLMVYLAWSRSKGSVSPEALAGIQEAIGSQLRDDPRPSVSEYGRRIVDWQPGKERRHLDEELAASG